MMELDQGARDRMEELRALLSARYPLRETSVELEGMAFRLVTVGDIDILLDEMIAAGAEDISVKDERLPYWAELWPSSLALGRFLVERAFPVGGREVVELGCGLGLSALVATRLGARVLLTDYQPLALAFSELNGLINLGESLPTTFMDWRHPDLGRRFDVVLASDVVYESRFFHPLLRTFRALLAPGGHILVSEPNRPPAQPFFTLLPQAGFTFVRHEVLIQVPYLERALAVGVYDIQLAEGADP